jgi:ATP-dependent exoDNAse (exonuclease V) alpha subunit
MGLLNEIAEKLLKNFLSLKEDDWIEWIRRRIMDKYQNNALVEEMDDIILLNDNYADKGLFKGYIGEVMENLIEERGFVVADFSNPIKAEYIQPVMAIQKEDFRVLSDSLADKKLVKEFKDLFRNK